MEISSPSPLDASEPQCDQVASLSSSEPEASRPINRRTLLSLATTAALGAILADLALPFGGTPAFAEPAWNYPFTSPKPVTSHFGPRVRPCPTCSTNHLGIDFGGGTVDIHAIAGGQVVAAVKAVGGWGHYVKVRHDNVWSSVYAHMAEGTMAVALNDTVVAGQRLGTTGETGTATGVHLHLEMHQNGVAIDPWPKLQSAPMAGAIIPPQPQPPEEDHDMLLVRNATTGEYAMLSPYGFQTFTDGNRANMDAYYWNPTKAPVEIHAHDYALLQHSALVRQQQLAQAVAAAVEAALAPTP